MIKLDIGYKSRHSKSNEKNWMQTYLSFQIILRGQCASMWVKDGETSLTCPEKKKPNMFGNKTKSNWCGYVSLCSRWKHALNYLFCVTLWPLDQSGLNTFENKTKHRLFLYIYLYICEQQSGHKKYEQSLKWNKEMNSEQKLCIKYKLFNKLIIINKSTYKTINMHNFEKTKNYLGYKVSFWAGKGPSDPVRRHLVFAW